MQDYQVIQGIIKSIMGVEIERKFLLQDSSWKTKKTVGILYRQGYLKNEQDHCVRIRVAGDKGFITIKGKTIGATRAEYEYEIPLDEAVEILETLCEKPLIEKIRYHVSCCDFVWEIDEFLGENQGLLIAEIELDHENQSFKKPDWLGKEVTSDSRYYNAQLVKTPYTKW